MAVVVLVMVLTSVMSVFAALPDLSVPSLRQSHLHVRHESTKGQIPDSLRARWLRRDHVVGGHGPRQGVVGAGVEMGRVRCIRVRGSC